MKILLPVDGSKPSLDAVRHALWLASQGLKSSYVLVNVQEPPSLYEVVTAHDVDLIEQVRSGAGIDLLHAAEALLDAAGVEFESEVASGDAVHGLVDLAENYGCDAVVMGARGAGDPEAGDIGSVALGLLRHSPVPVTLVRAPAPEEGADGEADDAAEG
jgi:nucleotide-binding universal stress UspA family protein